MMKKAYQYPQTLGPGLSCLSVSTFWGTERSTYEVDVDLGVAQGTATYTSAPHRATKRRVTRRTTIARRPAAVYQSHGVLGDHAHCAWRVGLELKSSLLEPARQLSYRLDPPRIACQTANLDKVSSLHSLCPLPTRLQERRVMFGKGELTWGSYTHAVSGSAR